MLHPDGKVMAIKKDEKVEEAFYKTGTAHLELMRDGSLQLTTYFSHDNYSPDSKKEVISFEDAKKKFGEEEIKKGIEKLLSGRNIDGKDEEEY